MSSKILSFVFASILASLLLVSAVSATFVSLSSSSVELSRSNSLSTVTLTENTTGLTVLVLNDSQVSKDSAGKSLTLKSTLSGNTLTLNASYDSALRFGDYSFIVPLSVTDGVTTEVTNVSVKFIQGFCKNGQVGENLTIDRVDISSSGEDDLAWKPLDEITVEVRVSNEGNDDVKEVTVDLELLDSNSKNIIGNMEFSNDDEDSVQIGTIKDGDDGTATFTFKVPADFNFDDGSDYKLVVKAYSDKTGESKECIDTTDDFEANDRYETISIDRQDDEDKFLAFDQIELSEEEATCGAKILLSGEAYNVGDSDQDELTIYLDSKTLGVKAQSEFKNGVDMDDSVPFSFEFTVPQGLKDGIYTLELSAEYEDGETDDATPVTIKVLGCTIAQPVQPKANETVVEDNEEPAVETSAWANLKSSFSGNAMIWVVAAINIILIVVIIIVAVRIARR
jgi:hypothetical protein